MEFTGDYEEARMGFVGSVAQRLEQGTHNPLVLGSNPSGPMFWGKVEGDRWKEVIHGLWAEDGT